MAMERGMRRSVVTEPAREVPVFGAYDVVVAGGGIAGVAAAVAAARNGVSVCLVDKACALGGLATLGNVTVWLPMCDGRGRQVIGGLAEDLLKLSVQDLGRDNPQARLRGIPACWKPGGDPEARKKVRYRVEFNPASYMLALEKLVTDAGVRVMYDTRVCAAGYEDGRVRHLLVENKSGRGALACGTVVDATGDADVCFLAGEETESLDSNVLCGWFHWLSDRGLALYQLSRKYSPYAVKEGADGPFFRGDDEEQVTAHLLSTRALIREKLAEFRARDPDAEVQPVFLPTMACLRMTRRLVGSFSLGQRDMHRWFEDAVGLTGDWRKAGPVYSIPFRTLCGVRMRNLLTAGRCISVDTTAWDTTRAIPTCALTGEASGTAAAMAVRDCRGDVHKLEVGALRGRLERQGGLLDPELVKPA